MATESARTHGIVSAAAQQGALQLLSSPIGKLLNFLVILNPY